MATPLSPSYQQRDEKASTPVAHEPWGSPAPPHKLVVALAPAVELARKAWCPPRWGSTEPRDGHQPTKAAPHLEAVPPHQPATETLQLGAIQPRQPATAALQLVGNLPHQLAKEALQPGMALLHRRAMRALQLAGNLPHQLAKEALQPGMTLLHQRAITAPQLVEAPPHQLPPAPGPPAHPAGEPRPRVTLQSVGEPLQRATHLPSQAPPPE